MDDTPKKMCKDNFHVFTNDSIVNYLCQCGGKVAPPPFSPVTIEDIQSRNWAAPIRRSRFSLVQGGKKDTVE